jgi:hypothetical protein
LLNLIKDIEKAINIRNTKCIYNKNIFQNNSNMEYHRYYIVDISIFLILDYIFTKPEYEVYIKTEGVHYRARKDQGGD